MSELHGSLPAIRQPEEISLKDVAETFVRSGYFRDAKQASQAAVKILFGRELGLGPGASMRGIHVFDGRMELASGTMTSLVNQAANYELEYVEDPTEANQWRCRLRLWRLSKRTGQWEALPDNSWTQQDTERAGLSQKDNWQRYPGAMAFARCLSQLFRRQCPELGAGPTYALGEVHDAQDAELIEITTRNGPAADELSVRARAARTENGEIASAPEPATAPPEKPIEPPESPPGEANAAPEGNISTDPASRAQAPLDPHSENPPPGIPDMPPPAPKQRSGFLWIRFVGRVDELLKELQELHEGNYRAADADYRKILREYGVQSRSDVDNEDTEKMTGIVLALEGHCEKLTLDRDAAQTRQAQPVQDGPTIDDRPEPRQKPDTAPIASSSPVAGNVEAAERQPAERPDRVDLASLPRDALLQEISRVESLNGASEENIVRNRKGAGFRGGALHAAPMAQLLVYAEDLVALNSI